MARDSYRRVLGTPKDGGATVCWSGLMARAYVICDIEVSDPIAYGRYRELSAAALALHGGRYLVRGGEAEVLEGVAEPHRIVVLEFDDMEAARRWYGSDAYVAARQVRQAAATASFILAAGYEPPG